MCTARAVVRRPPDVSEDAAHGTMHWLACMTPQRCWFVRPLCDGKGSAEPHRSAMLLSEADSRVG